MNCIIAGHKKYLLVSRSNFNDSDGDEYIILVVKNLTEQKLLEEQMERKQRLTAMGVIRKVKIHLTSTFNKETIVDVERSSGFKKWLNM